MSSDPLLVRDLGAERVNEQGVVHALSAFTYSFRKGYFYEISGESRGAKELLLRLLGLLIPPVEGEIQVDGVSLSNLSAEEISDVRNRKFGFLFSAPFLLPAFTVLENVAMPLLKIAQVDATEAKLLTEEVLEMTGIAGIADASIDEIGIYEQMLTALARAMIHQPSILIAEKVGTNLSEESTTQLLAALRRSSRRLGVTVVATLADNVRWQNSDVSLEIRADSVEEFVRNSRNG
jgi:ABC-type lipoprotein export system ATPase subunit